MENDYCVLLALPCGYDCVDVLKQITNLTHSFVNYLQQKQAAGVVNVPAPGTTEPVSTFTNFNFRMRVFMWIFKVFYKFC